MAILVALVALGIALVGWLFVLLGPFFNLYRTTPPQAAFAYLISTVGMSVAFVSLLIAFFTQQSR